MRIWLTMLGILAAGCGTAVAAQSEAEKWAAPAPAWEGVWQGTVGTAPVHVCLDATPYTKKGAYYYDRVKKLLRLEPASDSADDGRWFEQEVYDKDGAQWQVAMRDGALVGSWNDGKKQLSVRLSRIGVPSQQYDGPCGSMEFHRPRLNSAKLNSRVVVKDGNRYTVWSFKPGPWFGDDVEVATFTLDRRGPSIAKVNALLRTNLPKADGTGEWLDCIAAAANSQGSDGYFAEIIEPLMITDRWLSAKQHGGYFCGGAHPEDFSFYRTFDLASGTEINPIDWFVPDAVKVETYAGSADVSRTLKPAFVAMILEGRKPEDADCDEPVRSQEWWNIGIDRGSLVFSPILPRVIMACGDDYKVPIAKLQPWLNDKGKAAVATLPR